MIVRFTPQARADLAAIGEWIARDDPPRAISFVDALIDRAYDLGDGPERFPVVDRRRPDVRRRNHRGYRIFYRVQPDGVEVLAVHNGRRGSPGF